jgi:hypothetical protein
VIIKKLMEQYSDEDRKLIEKINTFNKMYKEHFPQFPTKQDSASLYHLKDNTVVGPHNRHENGQVVPSTADGYYTHINHDTLKCAFKQLLLNNRKNNYTIVSTGIRCTGDATTLLFDKFVNIFGGHVYVGDTNAQLVEYCKSQVSPKTTPEYAPSDTVRWLANFNKEPQIDLLCINFGNIDWMDPMESTCLHYREFQAIKHRLHAGSIIIIGDSPKSLSWMDWESTEPTMQNLAAQKLTYPIGRGTLISHELHARGDELLMHHYQMVWVVKKDF